MNRNVGSKATTRTDRGAALGRWMIVALGAGALASCHPGSTDPVEAARSPLAITHTFDLASNMPNRLAMMMSMSWFGVNAGDRNGTIAGTQLDATYGNWL